jgi:hypothetical protein
VSRIHLVATGGTVSAAARDGSIGLEPEARPAILDSLPPDAEATWSSPFRILSEDATSSHWTALARHVAELPLDRLDAVLVAHGSDTLAWSAAALSYLLRGIGAPVVLTGADLPLSDPDSNGPDNFRAAAAFALSEKLPGVFVAWKNPGDAAEIHLGTRLLPADPHLDRFRSPLEAPFGSVAEECFARLGHPSNPTRSDLVARSDQRTWQASLRTLESAVPLFEDRVLVLPDQPGPDHSPFLAGIGDWKAVVQIGHHSGTAGSRDGRGSFLELARAARTASVPVFLGPSRSRTPYASLAPLLDAGVRIAPHQAWPSLVVKIRHLASTGGLERLSEDLSLEILP